MTVTWRQIDTDNSGYVNGGEVQAAKQKGVKNVWNHMTETDYNNGTTREQKLASIKQLFPATVNRTIYNCNYSDDYENELLALYNKYNEYKKETAQELQDLEVQIGSGFKYAVKDCYTSLLDWSNDVLGTSFDTNKENQELKTKKKLMARRNEINHNLASMESDMSYLSYKIEYDYL